MKHNLKFKINETARPLEGVRFPPIFLEILKSTKQRMGKQSGLSAIA